MSKPNIKVTFSFFSRLGPGLLLAATSIGASHLVMSPKAGWMFGFQLLWLVPLTHLFKYHAFEFGPRYAAATGESLIAGYIRMPGPRGWALWILLFVTVAQGIGVLAGVVSIAAAVLSTFIGHEPFSGFYVILVIGTVLLFLVLGGYNWLDFLNKIMMTVLFFATIAVFVPAAPNLTEFKHFVIPSIPVGSMALIAAILGWMPTGIDVSIWHSLWTLEKHRELTSVQTFESRWKIFRLSLTDMRLGYILSFVVASVFLMLAAVYLHGTSDKIADAEFAGNLAKIYTDNIGSWMYFVFMVAAFTAMYSTVYAVMDGFSRAFAEMASTLFPSIRAKWRMKLYWIFVLSTAAFAILILLAFQGNNPVTLVLDVAFISLCVAPLYYGLNYYCVTRFIKEERFRPGTLARLVALSGIVVVLVATLICTAFKFGILK
ncbi:MAG: Nramp family divalent metal transporter [Sedimentisphaerales bacterium]|nr:Nramp family divalent metal transporter [Sedimentisphaerales bacterium]